MGGAPPLPLDFAPQGVVLEAVRDPHFGGPQGPQKRGPHRAGKTPPRIKVPGGVGGATAHYHMRRRANERAKELLAEREVRATTVARSSNDSSD